MFILILGFFVIGGVDVERASIRVTDPNVKFRRKFTKGQQLLTSFLNNGDKTLNAIILVYNKDGKPLADLDLKETQPFLKLNDKLIETIKDNLMDIVVYGRAAPFDRCNVYELLAPKLVGRKYALREYDLINAIDDLTLNRCSRTTDHIIPEAYKLGIPTPQRENDCTGAHFILEDFAMELFDDVPEVCIYFQLN